MLIREESARLEVPDDYVIHGPGKKMPGFYNLSQKLNRDFSILFVKSVGPKMALDAFGGTGVRGIRLAMETGANVVISEQSPKAYEYVLRNIAINNLEIKSYNTGFYQACDEGVFDYIDIDPYGSVVPYVDRAVTSVKPGGYLGFTATDLSSLTGSVPAKTRRRYGANITNDTFRHEMGIRLLISYIVHRAAVFDRAATPMFSFWNSHFYRLFFRVEKGVKKADRLIDQIGYINKRLILWGIYPDLEDGPVWTGRINDQETTERIAEHSASIASKELGRYLSLMPFEDVSLLFKDLTGISQYIHIEMPRINAVISMLRDAGWTAGRTEFSNTGIKSNCSIEDVISVLR